MASTSETGHAVNVANLGLLIAEVTQMDTLYNPTYAGITVAALNQKKTDCEKVLTDVINSTVPFKNAVNAREDAYEGMSQLATRVYNALAASGALPEIIKDARGIVNKITGRRTTKINPDNPDVKTISTSQMGFDNRKANFELLTALVKGEPAYNPNEDDLKVLELEGYITRLDPLNDAVNNTLAGIEAQRTERNELLYGAVTGVSDLAKKVKSYVKSVVGATSPIYKRIAAIQFRRVKN
jgi:hypothetical protein